MRRLHRPILLRSRIATRARRWLPSLATFSIFAPRRSRGARSAGDGVGLGSVPLGTWAAGGAALDVTDPEPVPDSHLLWFLDNVLLTPHVANTWDMALPELTSLVRRNVQHFAGDEPIEGVVDVGAGY